MNLVPQDRNFEQRVRASFSLTFLTGVIMSTIPRRRALAIVGAAVGLLNPIRLAGAVAPVLTAGLRFEIYRDARSKFRWRLKAGNNKVIGTSGEGYQAKADCRRAIDLIIREASSATVEEVGLA